MALKKTQFLKDETDKKVSHGAKHEAKRSANRVGVVLLAHRLRQLFWQDHPLGLDIDPALPQNFLSLIAATSYGEPDAHSCL